MNKKKVLAVLLQVHYYYQLAVMMKDRTIKRTMKTKDKQSTKQSSKKQSDNAVQYPKDGVKGIYAEWFY